jgi:hypothetical protein
MLYRWRANDIKGDVFQVALLLQYVCLRVKKSQVVLV